VWAENTTILQFFGKKNKFAEPRAKQRSTFLGDGVQHMQVFLDVSGEESSLQLDLVPSVVVEFRVVLHDRSPVATIDTVGFCVR